MKAFVFVAVFVNLGEVGDTLRATKSRPFNKSSVTPEIRDRDNRTEFVSDS